MYLAVRETRPAEDTADLGLLDSEMLAAETDVAKQPSMSSQLPAAGA